MNTDRHATASFDPPEPALPGPVWRPRRRPFRARRAARRLFLGFAAAGVVLVVLECGARVLKTAVIDLRDLRIENEHRAWSRLSPELGWEVRPGYQGLEGGYVRAIDEHGYQTVDSRQVADPAAPLVLFIGDSNTFGIGAAPGQTFAEVAERLAPGVAAINLGVPGYTSYQGLRVLERALPALRPAAVVVSFNFNDRKAALPHIGPDDEGSMRRIWRSGDRRLVVAGQVIRHSALADVARAAIVRLFPRPATRIRVDAMPTRVAPDRYRGNLRAMARLSQQAGVPIVFLILRDNPIFTRELTTGMGLLAERRHEEALAHLRFAIYNDNAFSELGRTYMARALHAIGHHTSAESVLVTDVPVNNVFGGRPIHLDGEYNDVMRRVGAELAVPVVDAGPVLHAHPIDYTDYCHFNGAAHVRVGALVAATLRDVLADTPATLQVAAGATVSHAAATPR